MSGTDEGHVACCNAQRGPTEGVLDKGYGKIQTVGGAADGKLFPWGIIWRGPMRRLLLLLIVLLVLIPLAVAQDGADTRRMGVEVRDEGCPAGGDGFCIQPGEIQADEGRTLVLEVHNNGTVRHNISAQAGSPDVIQEALDERALEPGTSTTVRLSWDVLEDARDAMDGRTLVLECGFHGHAALGERLVIHVGEEEERPQPGFTAGLALLAVFAALVVSRRKRA